MATARPGWQLGNGADQPQSELDKLTGMLVAEDACVEVQCVRRRSFKEMGQYLFVLSGDADFPACESDIKPLVDASVHVQAIRVTPRPDGFDHKSGMVATWCGTPVSPEELAARPGTHIETAGTPCWDYANEGRGERLEGVTVHVFFAWVVSVLFSMPDLVIHENVIGFPVVLLHLMFGHFFHIYTEEITPPVVSEFGVTRQRQYTFLKRMLYHAIESPTIGLLGGYGQKIHQRNLLLDTDFFVAVLPPELNPAYFLLSASMTKALDKHLEKHPDRHVFPLECSADWASCTASGMLGALKRNSTRRYHAGLKRWLLPSERMLAHGLPVVQWAADALGVQLRPQLTSAPPTVQNMLAGNGMHIMAVYAMLTFACTSGAPPLPQPPCW